MASRGNPHLVAKGLEFKHVFGGGSVGFHVHVVPSVRRLDEAATGVANPIVAAVVAGRRARLDGTAWRVDVVNLIQVLIKNAHIISVSHDELVVVSPQLIFLADILLVEIPPMVTVINEKCVGLEATVIVQIQFSVEDFHLRIGQMRVYQTVVEVPSGIIGEVLSVLCSVIHTIVGAGIEATIEDSDICHIYRIALVANIIRVFYLFLFQVEDHNAKATSYISEVAIKKDMIDAFVAHDVFVLDVAHVGNVAFVVNEVDVGVGVGHKQLALAIVVADGADADVR